MRDRLPSSASKCLGAPLPPASGGLLHLALYSSTNSSHLSATNPATLQCFSISGRHGVTDCGLVVLCGSALGLCWGPHVGGMICGRDNSELSFVCRRWPSPNRGDRVENSGFATTPRPPSSAWPRRNLSRLDVRDPG